jgi:hypothetical protein
VVVLLLFLRVLGPVSSKLKGQQTEDMFFLKNAAQYDCHSYREALQKTDLLTSYADQVLKIARNSRRQAQPVSAGGSRTRFVFAGGPDLRRADACGDNHPS